MGLNGQPDDPHDYFRRLQSYTAPRSSSPPKSRPGPYTHSGTRSYSSSGPRRYPDSPPKSYTDSPPKSYTDSPSKSRAGTPSKSRAESPPKTPAESPPKSYTPSRPNSYLSSRPDSYTTSRPDSYTSSDLDSYRDSLPLTYDSEKPPRRKHKSYKQHHPVANRDKKRWTRKRKIVVFSTVAVVLILLIIIVGAVVGSRKSGYSYTPSDAHVTNQTAFASGGATHSSPNSTLDGIGAGQDKYTYYQGGPERFPPSSAWVSFEQMWQINLAGISQACTNLDEGEDNSPENNQDIYDAIQDRANASLVDHRFILAIILQESHGCARVGQTKSSGGVNNPGLMQSHNGDAFSSSAPKLSILAMVQDGTQGTEHGDGLVQNLNIYGDPYSASRGYNSGYIPKSGDLSEEAGATACYVSDVANRLTGWVNAKSTCPDSGYK